MVCAEHADAPTKSTVTELPTHPLPAVKPRLASLQGPLPGLLCQGLGAQLLATLLDAGGAHGEGHQPQRRGDGRACAGVCPASHSLVACFGQGSEAFQGAECQLQVKGFREGSTALARDCW